MRYVLLTLVSLCVGAAVYLISLRIPEEEPVAIGFEPRPPEPDVPPGEPPPGYTYLQVPVTRGPSLRERLQGLLGSLALVATASAGLAISLYAIGALIARVIRSYVRP